MGLFGKIFGRQHDDGHAAAPAPSGDPRQDKNLIRVFDHYGRELFISRQQWRDSVLLENLKKSWDQADALYDLIVSALNDGFRADVVDAAKHLHEIDHNHARGACVWGIVLMEEGRLDEAEKVLRGHLADYGEDGIVLTNLAKVLSRRNDDRQSEQVLWRALELDPNQENGLLWFVAIHKERGGAAAEQQALQRVAVLKGSWRAPLWLARAALSAGQLSEAIASYQRSLDQAGKPCPGDLLMQMSGDLGNAGHLRELLSMTEPHFDAKLHGLEVGNNLIKAHLELGHVDQARNLLDQLFAQGRPDWKDTLAYWDTEIGKARVSGARLESDALQIAMLGIDGPVWLSNPSRAAALFPEKPRDEMVISFLGSSVTKARPTQVPEVQLADEMGRMSRAVPMFLAEQTYFGTRARVQTLIPWITGGGNGFVLSGRAWTDEEGVNCARQSAQPGDFVVMLHLNVESTPWKAELRLVRVSDGKRVATLEAPLTPQRPQDALPRLVERLLAVLTEHAQVRREPLPEFYKAPDADMLPNYLLRLEQLLAVRCSTMNGVPPGFLHGEREIIDGNLQLCLWLPANVTTRLLLAQTVQYMNRVRPDVVEEYRAKLARLQQEHALASPAHAVVSGILEQGIGKPDGN